MARGIMTRLLIIIILPLVFLALIKSAYSQTEPDKFFCQNLIRANQIGKPLDDISFEEKIHLFKNLGFNPGSLVTLADLREDQSRQAISPLQEDENSKHAFLLFKDTQISRQEMKEIKRLKEKHLKLKLMFHTSPITRKLKKVQTEDDCFRILQKHKAYFEKFSEMDRIENQAILSKSRNLKLRKLLMKKVQKLQKAGFKVKFVDGYPELASEIISLRNAKVLIVSHSNEKGDIVDGNDDKLPHGFFQALSPYLNGLTLFTCHPKAVFEKNELNGLEGLEFLQPVLDPMVADIYKTTIPLIALDAATNVFQSQNYPKHEYSAYCSIEFETENSPAGHYIISHGLTFIGTLSPERTQNKLFVDCNKLKSMKEMQLHTSGDQNSKAPLNLLRVSIQGPGLNNPAELQFRTFLNSKGQLIVTKIFL